MVRMRRLIFNAATFVPGVAAIPAVRRRIVNRAIGTGGTISGRYCYSVWLRHLLWAANSGLQTSPHVVAELGPGDSLGTGIAALLSGAEQYFALDVVAHANADRNLEILDELVALFSAQADIPGDREFPGMYPKLGDYRFPSAILGRERIAAALQSDRITRIRHSLTDTAAPGSMVQYRAPWLDGSVIQPGAIDMIFSQAALEHIDELEQAYRDRSSGKSPLEVLIWKLTGLDLKLQQYTRGEAFCKAIYDAHGMKAVNQVWNSEAHMPRLEELAQPEAWYRRVVAAQRSSSTPSPTLPR